MPESYHEWLDRELVKDHEADPESFRQPIITMPTESDAELLARIEYLKRADWLGSWGTRHLSIAQAEATSRKIKIDR